VIEFHWNFLAMHCNIAPINAPEPHPLARPEGLPPIQRPAYRFINKKSLLFCMLEPTLGLCSQAFRTVVTGTITHELSPHNG
jgi:hypothetical protein